VFLILVAYSSQAQQVSSDDSTSTRLGQPLLTTRSLPADSGSSRQSLYRHFRRFASSSFARKAVVPAAFLTWAVLNTEKVDMTETDELLRSEVQKYPRPQTSIDDHLRHVPALASLSLSLLGIKGKHSTLNQALLFGLTYTINNTITSNLKRMTHVQRPNGQSYDSFPSQHTSAAFSAATLLHKEYGGRSIWYSIAGYGVAATTGGLRIAKDNHWLSDVLAGAGVGIISTELAYWAYPWLHRQLRKSLGDRAIIIPSYLDGAAGATLVVVL
jgi:hypothetical protein